MENEESNSKHIQVSDIVCNSTTLTSAAKVSSVVDDGTLDGNFAILSGNKSCYPNNSSFPKDMNSTSGYYTYTVQSGDTQQLVLLLTTYSSKC